MGNWIDDLKVNKTNPTSRSEGSWLDRFKDNTPSQTSDVESSKHSWNLSEDDNAKMEKKRRIDELKSKGIDKLKEEWSQMKSLELIKLAREIGAVLNDARDNERDIDTTLLSYLDELRKILEERDTSGAEIEQTLGTSITTSESQEQKDDKLKKQKRLEELAKIKQYIKRMQILAKKQQNQRKQETLEEMEEDDSMSM